MARFPLWPGRTPPRHLTGANRASRATGRGVNGRSTGRSSMNLEEIDRQYSAQVGKMSDSLDASYDRIRESFDLTDAERETAAVEAHGKAVDAHWQATVE